MIKLSRVATDYGRGPKRWYWMSGYHSVPFFGLFRHPVKALKILLWHEYDDA